MGTSASLTFAEGKKDDEALSFEHIILRLNVHR